MFFINQERNITSKFCFKELSEELLKTHYKSVQYEKTDYVVPWNVLKTYKIKNKTISEDTLVCLVGHLKNQGKCKIGIAEDNERVICKMLFNLFDLKLCYSLSFII